MSTPTRERLVHALYEAAELEHDLMCTYLYAAFSLKTHEDGGLSANEAEAAARWRSTIMRIAIEEMGHLVGVWNITAALGGTPRFSRENFPLSAGVLPASVVAKLAPFGDASLQHFIHLERPITSDEPDGEGFEPEVRFTRGVQRPRLTPMGMDYQTVGEFYATLGEGLRLFVEKHGESGAFCGDPALQLSATETEIVETKPVICLKTVTATFDAIIAQGEGAPGHSAGSHFQRFSQIRDELKALRAANPAFAPAMPAAHNPLLRPPVRAEGRVWIENEEAAGIVDLANAGYGLMLRLLGESYRIPRPAPEKRLVVDLAMGLMRAFTPLAERAARLPAGPSHPHCNAGVSFTALRDSAPLMPGPSAARFFVERFEELAAGAATLDTGDPRVARARRVFDDLLRRATRGFANLMVPAPATVPMAPAAPMVSATPMTPPAPAATVRAAPRRSPALAVLGPPPTPVVRDGIDYIEGENLTLVYDGKKCIHSRFCVTGAPSVFIANVQGPWIQPDAIGTEALVEIAHACPSGAIRYLRKDGQPDEAPPAVNLIGIRENGPYAVRADLRIDGDTRTGYRATLCRCGASRNKPFCDSSHKTINFVATGEPPTGTAVDMLPVRDGPLDIDPELDGPLHVRGNLEIISGTGRVVARVTQAKLCRCGGSATKPFCDGTHQRIGFRSDRATVARAADHS